MANTAAVYARIDPKLKKEVEEIIAKLGITPSSLIQMLYSEIRLTHKVPLSLSIPEEAQTKVSQKIPNDIIDVTNKSKVRRQSK